MKKTLLITHFIAMVNLTYGQFQPTAVASLYYQTTNAVRGVAIGQPGATFTPALYVRGDLLDNGTHSTGEVFETVGLDNVDNAWRLKTKTSGGAIN